MEPERLRDRVREILADLPDLEESPRKFERGAGSLIEDPGAQLDDEGVGSRDLKPILRGILSGELESEGSEAAREQTRFAALVALHTHARHVDDFEAARELLLRYREDFQHLAKYWHLRAISAKAEGRTEETIEFCKAAISKGEEIAEKDAGFLHTYAAAIIKAHLDGGRAAEDAALPTLERAGEMLEQAQELSRAESAEGKIYPKFLYTHGRLLTASRQFEKAAEMYARAIETENSDREDYTRRILSYKEGELDNTIRRVRWEERQEREHLEQVIEAVENRAEQKLDEMDETLAQAKLSIESVQSEFLQFLGFFSAVIAVVLGSVNIASGRPVGEAAQLIALFTGGLLFVMGTFSLLIHPDSNPKMRLASAVVGLGCAVGAFFYVVVV